jgi:hypothetical protein
MRFAVDRLAHLFGAGGAHGAVVLVEAQAGVLEGQAAVVEQAAHLASVSSTMRLVDTRWTRPGSTRVEVRHQRDVVAVVAAEVVEVVREVLAARESAA